MKLSLAVLLCQMGTLPLSSAWLSSTTINSRQKSLSQLQAKQAGSFFNQVPDSNDDEDDDDDANTNTDDSFEEKAAELLRQRKRPSLASQPSTINGKPTAGVGFGSSKQSKIKPAAAAGNSKPFVGIGPRLNDPTRPEYDDQGYTLYADEATGTKSRVFEALVDYPCKFTMKIVGAGEGNFVQEMVAVVAESCEVEAADISHSIRTQGKWVSVTVKAPVSVREK